MHEAGFSVLKMACFEGVLVYAVTGSWSKRVHVEPTLPNSINHLRMTVLKRLAQCL
jgi:hypothetical protein